MQHIRQHMVGPAQMRQQFFVAVLFGMLCDGAADQVKAVSFFMVLRVHRNAPAVFPFSFCLMFPKLLFIPVVDDAEQFIDPFAPVGIDDLP